MAKTFNCYFHGKPYTKLYACSVWADSEEQMLSVLKDNYDVIEDLAYCQTKLLDDKQEGFPPIVMETVFDMTDKGKLKELKTS